MQKIFLKKTISIDVTMGTVLNKPYNVHSLVKDTYSYTSPYTSCPFCANSFYKTKKVVLVIALRFIWFGVERAKCFAQQPQTK